MTQLFMHEMTREEINEKARAGYAIVIPLAATEQHGPQLPVYTDSLICEYIASESIRQASAEVSILMAPIVTIGCSEHHLTFGGTISFKSSTYLQMLRDIGESLITDGFRKIIFLNAHGGNHSMMIQTANDLAVYHPVWTAAASYWNVANQELAALNASEMGMVPGHAGGFETAVIMALRPDLVRNEPAVSQHLAREWINSGPPGTFIGKHKELTGHQGYTDAADRATAAKGQQYLDAIVNSVANWLIDTVRAMKAGGE
ncbi:creatininase [Paenibacillus sp. FSL H8-0548]|uniref:creatininase family protein n=1 Tax=Paenibacillus sp. FSL H8-0548 TaxID=1920422 RepID=UPI00096D83CD|nr:creatininase family protein [Paenibacillus sp. FSL H8-0548]OMF34651.1 creatininase [Paenibacillus sp. FSL H8-0548]